MQYALYFVPHKLEREKIALERRRLCKRFKNRKAIMYPVHMTLVRELRVDTYKEFMNALKEFCAGQKPIKLTAEKNLVTKNGWGGIEIKNKPALKRFQKQLEQVAKKHAHVAQHSFDPHISLVYAKNLPSLHTKTSPVKKLVLDRVTLCLQTKPGTPFRIVKHLPLGLNT